MGRPLGLCTNEYEYVHGLFPLKILRMTGSIVVVTCGSDDHGLFHTVNDDRRGWRCRWVLYVIFFWIQKSAGFLRLRRGSRGTRALLVWYMEPGFAFGPCTSSVLCTVRNTYTCTCPIEVVSGPVCLDIMHLPAPYSVRE
jgi:hypothetical protein